MRFALVIISNTLSVLCGSDAFSFDATNKRSYVHFQPPSNEDYLTKLEGEYKSMEDSLLRELATTNVHGRAEEIVEDMLEKAADVAAFQRYRMAEIVDEADDDMKHARDDRRRAHFVKERAHDEAISAAREAAMVEEFDAAYEDLERARDLSVVHSDHSLERDAAVLEEESEIIELDAGDRKKQALHLLKELRENEAELRASLDELRKRRNEQAMGEWRESEEAKAHSSFLERVRNKLKHYSIRKHADNL
eukprot:CAMPEP_0178625024 /NCGR_PEP_ID=MMETSP0698-20121128/7659_1 /TAXON_ID=265572 /ORGANISM="Extubocellulus spinifer, Strain CCMP396" /LENGTH=249 /DNA_ID=CAMNT_0020264163 /DNA_START=15 /DNA_END=764 /DNA_ORIENTATION=+